MATETTKYLQTASHHVSSICQFLFRNIVKGKGKNSV